MKFVLQRFIVAGFCYDVDRTQVFLEEQTFISMCCLMKWLIENSGIPFTYIIPNFLIGGVFGRKDDKDPTSLSLKFPIYGDGYTRGIKALKFFNWSFIYVLKFRNKHLILVLHSINTNFVFLGSNLLVVFTD